MRTAFALVVVDVSGHGARAAIVMAMIRAVIHTDCGPLADPAAVLQRLNRHFRYLWDTSMYATAIAAVLDVERGVIRMSSAGHPPPLVIRDGQVAPFPAINGPLLFWDEIARSLWSWKSASSRATGWCSTPTASPIASDRATRDSTRRG